jgi:hypothetical protein
MKSIILLPLLLLLGCNADTTFFNNITATPQQPTVEPRGSLTYAIVTTGITNNSIVSGATSLQVLVTSGKAPYTFTLESSIGSQLQDKDNSGFTWVVGNNTGSSNVLDTVKIVDSQNNFAEINLNVSNVFTVANIAPTITLYTQETIGQIVGGVPPYLVQIASDDQTNSFVQIEQVNGLNFFDIIDTAGNTGTETFVVTDSNQNSFTFNVESDQFFVCPLVEGQAEHTCPIYGTIHPILEN